MMRQGEKEREREGEERVMSRPGQKASSVPEEDGREVEREGGREGGVYVLESLMSCLQQLVNKSEVRRVHSCSCWLENCDRTTVRMSVRR